MGKQWTGTAQTAEMMDDDDVYDEIQTSYLNWIIIIFTSLTVYIVGDCTFVKIERPVIFRA